MAVQPWLVFTRHRQYRPTIDGDFGEVNLWSWEDHEPSDWAEETEDEPDVNDELTETIIF
jgi:hypothetical protein